MLIIKPMGGCVFTITRLKSGMTFSFSKLVTDFLTVLDASPSQLLPTAWRILACLDSIEAKYNLSIDMSVVSYAYQAKKFSGGLYVGWSQEMRALDFKPGTRS